MRKSSTNNKTREQVKKEDEQKKRQREENQKKYAETLPSFRFSAKEDISRNKVLYQQDPVVYVSDSSREPFWSIVLESIPNPKVLELMKKKINAFLRGKNVNPPPYQIIALVPWHIKRNTNVYYEYYKNTFRYLTNFGIDLRDYINPRSVVLMEGSAVEALTEGNVKYSYLKDKQTNDFWFYEPGIRCPVYPIPRIYRWVFERMDGTEESPTKGYDLVYVSTQFRDAFDHEIDMRRIPKRKRIPIRTPEELQELLYDQYQDAEWVAIDTETDSLDWMHARCGCVTLSFERYKGYFVYWDALKPDKKAFSDFIKNKKQIYHNGRFDIKVLYKNGIDRDALHIDYDTMDAGQVLNENRSNTLKTLAYLYTPFGGYDEPLEQYKKQFSKKSTITYLQLPPHLLEQYATDDAIVTYLLFEETLEEMRWFDAEYPMTGEGFKATDPPNTLEGYYFNHRIPASNAHIDSEIHGVLINIDVLRRLEREFAYDLSVSRQKARKAIGLPDSFRMTDSIVADWLEDQLGLPCYGRTEMGHYTIDDSAMKKWIRDGYTYLQDFVDYRKKFKIFSTYIGHEFLEPNLHKNAQKGSNDEKTPPESNGKAGEGEKNGYWQHLYYHGEYHEKDYRVHSNFFVMMKATHRSSSEAPNLQQVIKHAETYAVRYKVIEDDGTVYDLFQYDTVRVKRNGDVQDVFAYELQESDRIISVDRVQDREPVLDGTRPSMQEAAEEETKGKTDFSGYSRNHVVGALA